MIPEAQRRQLLEIARDAIAATLGRASSQIHPTDGFLAREAGAFVTLHIHGELRGCIGQVEADRPLADVVASCAVSAARSDPRFPPVTAEELDTVDIEVSVLSGFDPVHSIADIEVGRHGLLIESGWRRGLLLPQVATEWQWDAETFLSQTCRKAGLPPDSWKHAPTVKLWRFEAEVFGEKEQRNS